MKLLSTPEVWLDSLGASTMRLGLARMTRLLKTLGNPEQGLPLIHIAGTNGKGSVVAMLGSILKAAGYRTGSYTSPHLLHVRERIAVDGNPILRDDFEAGIKELMKVVSQLLWEEDGQPTYFEALNALAFLYFKRLYTQDKLDLALLETGLGGRLDSTNVVKNPLVCVITGIAEDHTEYLGTTLAAIAAEKAGIIKPGVPVVVGPGVPEEALTVITRQARDCDAPCIVASAASLAISPQSRPGTDDGDGLLITDTSGDTNTRRSYRLPLTAPYQRENLATALVVLNCLRQQGYDISDAAVTSGLAQTRWPARFQFFEKQRVVLDASHNAQGFEALTEAVAFYFPDKPLYWLLSLRNNRDPQLLRRLLARFEQQTQGVIFTRTEPEDSYHAPQALADTTHDYTDNPLQGFAQLQRQLQANPEAIGIVTGSLYTAGKLLQQL